MKTFAKVFIISFACFLFAMAIGSYSYVDEKGIKLESNIGGSFYKAVETKPKPIEYYSNLKEAIEKSNRINFLILGMEGVRTDTIMLASFCPDTKKVDLINIPRDTYIHRKGYNGATERKINSVYATHGVKGLEKTVSYILEDIPIHHNIMLEYAGVEKLVNEMGGIEVDIPFDMKYKDPTANPPLDIDISSGKQILDGKKSLEFLRYRKGNNNRGGYADGDLGRIKAQQGFIKSFIDKCQDNILTVIAKGFSYVKTDISLVDLLAYGRKSIGMKKEDCEIIILPGKGEFKKVNKQILSYFIYNSKDTKNIIEKIYKVKDPNNS